MPDAQDVHLFIPGPAGADPEVQAELGHPIRPHYGPDFVAAYNRCRERFKRLFGTEQDLYLIVGPGTAALDAALASALPDGSRVLALANGWFGARMAEMCEAHRLEVERMDFPLGGPLDTEAVVERLRNGPPVDAVVWTHHETSTGVLNSVEPISKAARAAGALSIIDAVSSLAGAPLRVDDWQVDLCVSVANKGIAANPGLAAITVSEQAWEAIDANPSSRSWYLDLRTWRKYDTKWADWHPYPTTVSSNQVDALSLALQKILREGVERRVERTAAAADRVRQGLRELGFTMFADDDCASPVTTAVNARPDLPVGELITELKERHGIYISGGLDELAGKIFRIGHMGEAIREDEVELLLDAIAGVLRRRGLLQKERAGVDGV